MSPTPDPATSGGTQSCSTVTWFTSMRTSQSVQGVGSCHCPPLIEWTCQREAVACTLEQTADVSHGHRSVSGAATRCARSALRALGRPTRQTTSRSGACHRCAPAPARSTSMAEPITPWGAWDEDTRNDPYPLFEAIRAEMPGAAGSPRRRSRRMAGPRSPRRAPGAQRPPALEGHDRRARPGPRRRRPGSTRTRPRSTHDEPRSARPHPVAPPRVASVRAHPHRRGRTSGPARRRRVAHRAGHGGA